MRIMEGRNIMMLPAFRQIFGWFLYTAKLDCLYLA